MIKAFDTATPLSPAVAARARAAGYRAVGRYYGSPGSGKLLTAGEVTILSDAGLAVWCYFERTAGRALAGEEAGVVDADRAALQALACGQPLGTGICFAVDADAEPDAVLPYFAAVKDHLIGRFQIGVYGGGAVCARVVGARFADYEILAGAMGWQGSRDYRDGRLWEGLQYSEVPAHRSGLGIAIDPVDLVGFGAVGAWSTAGAFDEMPIAMPAPGVTYAAAVATAILLQQQLRDLGLYSWAIDGQVGPLTSSAALRAWRLASETTAGP